MAFSQNEPFSMSVLMFCGRRGRYLSYFDHQCIDIGKTRKCFSFKKNSDVVVEPLKIPQDTLYELEDNLLCVGSSCRSL